MRFDVKTLLKVASRYAPSRVLSFDLVHIFKVLQLIGGRGHASRALLCRKLGLGEGSIRTLVKHLKMYGPIETTMVGSVLTNKGRTISSELLSSIPAETSLPGCSVALGRFNYAVLLKGFGFAIRSGIGQRDAAVGMGALGATTLLFREEKFVMPGRSHDSLRGEPIMRRLLIEKLRPEEEDILIIGSVEDAKTAELASKNTALLTMIARDKHL